GFSRDWSSDVCSSDLGVRLAGGGPADPGGLRQRDRGHGGYRGRRRSRRDAIPRLIDRTITISGMQWVWGAAVLLLVIVGYVWWLSGRVRRLHRRAEAATAALDAKLVRRAAASAVLAEQLA